VTAQRTVSVLLSGGVDSTACVAFFLGESFAVRGLFIEYEQAALAKERG
jgi:7-cyano-7-deazaguanine synthase in queuosine biosynthesis